MGITIADFHTHGYYSVDFIASIDVAEQNNFIVHTNSRENDLVLVDFDSKDLKRFLSLVNIFSNMVCEIDSVVMWKSKSKGLHAVVKLLFPVAPAHLLMHSAFLGGDEKHVMIAYHVLKNIIHVDIFDRNPISENNDHRFMALFQPPDSVKVNVSIKRNENFKRFFVSDDEELLLGC